MKKGFLIFFILLLSGLPVLAADAPTTGAVPAAEGPVAAERELDAKGLMALALRLTKEGDLDGAIDAYRTLLDRYPVSRFRHRAYYEMGLLLYREGRLEEAGEAIKRVVSGWWVKGELKEKARLVLREIDSILKRGSQGPGAVTIGAVLPLKGPYAPYGEAALKGILLAADVFGSMRQNPVEVVVKDSSGLAYGPRSAVRQLASDRDVVGVVGPLLASTAHECADEAEKRGLPMITLARTGGIAAKGEYIFRNSAAPEEQASAVADYAYNSLGMRRFALLFPDDPYGSTAANAFVEEVLALGAEIVGIGAYRKGDTDFSGQIEEIFQVEEKETVEGRRVIKEYEPTVEVDAFFIPDDYRAVALVLPFLNYFNIEAVQLLGTSGWNTAQLVRLGGRSVEGAVFVDDFFYGSPRPGAADFTENFTRTYGRHPVSVEAEAYDAARLLISAVGDGATDRISIMERLREKRDFTGAGGPLRFDAAGEPVRHLFVLTVKDGAIVEAPGGAPEASMEERRYYGTYSR